MSERSKPSAVSHSGAFQGDVGASRSQAWLVFITLALTLTSGPAYAQQIGGGIINYAIPIIVFCGVVAVVVGLFGGMFNAALLRGAVAAIVILIIIFYILHNVGAFTAAAQT